MNKPSGNFFLLPNHIFDEDMDLKEFAVYAYLTKSKGKDNKCWPSRETIGRNCKIKSLTTVDRALKGLSDKGYIAITPRYDFDGKGRLSSIYTVNKLEKRSDNRVKFKKFQ